MNKTLFSVVLVGAVLLSACGGGSNSSTSTPEPLPDTTAPTITISPEVYNYDLIVGDEVPEISVTAVDDVDGDISSQIQISGDTVNNEQAGTYIVNYDVTDTAGNQAEQVNITFKFMYPPSPDDSYGLVIDGELLDDFSLTVVEGQVIALHLSEVGNSLNWHEVAISEVSGPNVDFESSNQSSASTLLLVALDDDNEQNPISFGFSQMYAQFPHVNEDSTIYWELNSLDNEGNIIYSDILEITLLDQGDSLPESGFYKEELAYVETGTILAIDYFTPWDYQGFFYYDEFFGVSQNQFMESSSFVKSADGGHEDSIEEPFLDGLNTEDLVIREGFTINKATNQLILPKLADNPNSLPFSSVENAVIKEIPSDLCNYFEGVMITPNGTVTSDGAIIQEQMFLCHIGKYYDVNTIYDQETKSIKIIDFQYDGSFSITDSVSLDPQPADSWDVVLFNESGLVFKDENQSDRHIVYTFPSDVKYEERTQPQITSVVEVNTSEITDILVNKNTFGDVLLVANPNHPFVTVLHDLDQDDPTEEIISFDWPIEWIKKSENFSDFKTLHHITFSGRNSKGLHTRKDISNNDYD